MFYYRPPVAPIEGYFAFLRNGLVARISCSEFPQRHAFYNAYMDLEWNDDGTAKDTHDELGMKYVSDYDIIALATHDQILQVFGIRQLANPPANNDHAS